MHRKRRTSDGSPPIASQRPGRRRRAILSGLPLLLACAAAAAATGQPPPLEPATGDLHAAASPAQPAALPTSPTPLAALVAEAEQRNPQLLAARQAWKAATQLPSQASTLPDPELNLQQVNVGSPLPFAGYTTSDFAYFGIGVSQDLPYPGKLLRLRGQIAERDAAAAETRVEAVRRSTIEQLKVTYIRLACIQQTVGIQQRDAALLSDVAQIAGTRYRFGQGSQQDVLRGAARAHHEPSRCCTVYQSQSCRL
jgi:cobalt-zinc-cadmium efflux system outer membrane protein